MKRIMADAELFSLQAGMPKTLGEPGAADPNDREWTTALFKETVHGSRWLGTTQLEGDGQADRENHGGPDMAINVYPAEHYPHWAATLDRGTLPYGAFGENFTTRGLVEDEVRIGDTFHVGASVIVQVSQPRQPCWKIARRWKVKDLALQVQQTGFTGWYFRVLHEGPVAAGDTMRLGERGDPTWTISAVNRVVYGRKDDRAAARALAACPALSAGWKEMLRQRADG